MGKVLVTGASGFIGFHLVRALVRRGDEVTCLVRKTSRLDRLEGLPYCRAEGDLRDAESLVRAVAGQDAVYHLAGLVKAAWFRDLYRANCEGTGNLVRACAAAPTPPRLLVVSSLAAMGPSLHDRPRLESDPPKPISAYGRTKLAAEYEARKWARSVPISIIRPPIVIGEGDPGTLQIFRPIAAMGLHIVPHWRTHEVSLVHAADLAAAMMLAVERGPCIAPDAADAEAAARGCYFIKAERDVTYAELGRMIGAALGRRHTRVLHVGPLAVWAAAWCGTASALFTGQPWYFNIDKAREARAGTWTCSSAAVERELGFAVARPLEERLRETVDWYREKKWL